MNFDQLVTFLTVSNVKSFRRAAEALHLSQPAVEVIGLEAQKKLVQLGLGVTLLPKPFVTNELKEGTLRTFKVKGTKLRCFSCLVYRRDKYIHGAMQGFLELLREVFAPAKGSSSSHHP